MRLWPLRPPNGPLAGLRSPAPSWPEATPGPASTLVDVVADDVVKVEVRQLDPELPLPAYARPGDAGADLRARADVTIPAGRRAGAGPDRVGPGHTGGLRRLRPASQRAGTAPWRHRAERPRPHRRWLP